MGGRLRESWLYTFTFLSKVSSGSLSIVAFLLNNISIIFGTKAVQNVAVALAFEAGRFRARVLLFWWRSPERERWSCVDIGPTFTRGLAAREFLRGSREKRMAPPPPNIASNPAGYAGYGGVLLGRLRLVSPLWPQIHSSQFSRKERCVTAARETSDQTPVCYFLSRVDVFAWG